MRGSWAADSRQHAQPESRGPSGRSKRACAYVGMRTGALALCVPGTQTAPETVTQLHPSQRAAVRRTCAASNGCVGVRADGQRDAPRIKRPRQHSRQCCVLEGKDAPWDSQVSDRIVSVCESECEVCVSTASVSNLRPTSIVPRSHAYVRHNLASIERRLQGLRRMCLAGQGRAAGSATQRA